ncbi:MAG: hypothetical protein II743_01370 [Lachnospiraceae bacterium]|nr:hypothetical protein [Lachnospiraceae bacterium]
MKNKIYAKMISFRLAAEDVKEKALKVLVDRRGENYVDTAVKILIAVVLGALLLAGLYALFGDVVMPTLSQRVQEMFDYQG